MPNIIMTFTQPDASETQTIKTKKNCFTSRVDIRNVSCMQFNKFKHARKFVSIINVVFRNTKTLNPIFEIYKLYLASSNRMTIIYYGLVNPPFSKKNIIISYMIYVLQMLLHSLHTLCAIISHTLIV